MSGGLDDVTSGRWAISALGSTAHEPQALALRCRIVLACADGGTNTEVAEGVADLAGQALDGTAPILPLTPGTKHNGTTNLYAALDVASGHVIADMTARHRTEEFQRFLNLIDKSVPEHLSWNEEPQPFVWHKTADEILNSLASYCNRISDSGH